MSPIIHINMKMYIILAEGCALERSVYTEWNMKFTQIELRYMGHD